MREVIGLKNQRLNKCAASFALGDLAAECLLKRASAKTTAP